MGRRPLDLHAREVGEMHYTDFWKLIRTIAIMSAGLVIMGVVGWLEAPGL